MFSPTSNIQPAGTPWHAAVWHAVDRVVAFATLDAYGVEAPHAAVDGSGAHQDRLSSSTPKRPRRPAPAPRTQHCAPPLPATSRRRTLAEPAHRPQATRGFGLC